MKDISLYEKHLDQPKKFPIIFNIFNGANTLRTHWHEHIELLFFCSGSFDVFCNGTTHKVEKNGLIVVNSTEIHSFTGTGLTKNYCILLYPSFFSDVSFDNIFIKNHIADDEFITECMHKIAAEATLKSDGWEMMIKSYVYSLMTYLLRNYSEPISSRTDTNSKSINLRRLDKVLTYIEKHYNEELTTNKLAEMCYLDTSYFCRFFKNATGKSVISYINEYRIEKAVFYLETTDETITKIANSVGFDDVNYFCRVFKKIKNDTPAKYRENFLKK